MIGKTNSGMMSNKESSAKESGSMKLDFPSIAISVPNGYGDTKGNMLLPAGNRYSVGLSMCHDMGFIPSQLTYLTE